MRRCKKCGEEKPISSFADIRSHCPDCQEKAKHKKRATSNKWFRDNREQHRESIDRYQKKHRDRYLAARKLHRIRRKYGITIEEYDRMFFSQGGCCAICRKPHTGPYRMNIDHNHTTEQIRGLLCSRCNSGIGMALEDTGILRAMIAYLDFYNGATPESNVEMNKTA